LRELDPTDPEDIPGAAFEHEPEPAVVVPSGNGVRPPVPEAVPG